MRKSDQRIRKAIQVNEVPKCSPFLSTWAMNVLKGLSKCGIGGWLSFELSGPSPKCHWILAIAVPGPTANHLLTTVTKRQILFPSNECCTNPASVKGIAQPIPPQTRNVDNYDDSLSGKQQFGWCKWIGANHPRLQAQWLACTNLAFCRLSAGTTNRSNLYCEHTGWAKRGGKVQNRKRVEIQWSPRSYRGQEACDGALGKHQVIIDIGLKDIAAPQNIWDLTNMAGFLQNHAISKAASGAFSCSPTVCMSVVPHNRSQSITYNLETFMVLKYLNYSLFRNWQQAGSETCLNYLNKLLQGGVQGVQLVFGRNLHLRARGRTPEATQHGFLIVSISMIWIDMPPTWIKTLQPPEILYGDGQKGALAGSSSSDIQGPDWLWLWIQNLEHALEYHKHHEHQWKQLSCCGAVAGFHKVLKRSKHE